MTIRRAGRSLCVGAIVASLAACEAGGDVRAFEARDSAGIRLAINRAPEWGGGDEGWRVDSVPRLAIGVQDGEPEYQFFGLLHATRLPDGTLLASNIGSSELRFFSGTGDFLRAVGGQGAGPGEFGEFSNLRICRVGGDRLVVPDAANDRINVFDLAGEYLGTHRIGAAAESGGRPAQVVGCLSDDRLLGMSWPGGGVLRGEPGDVIEGEQHYVAIDTTGAISGTLAEASSRPRFVNQAAGVTHYPYIPLHPEALYAGGHGALYLTRDGTASVERRTATGEVASIVRWQGASRQPVASVWDRFVEHSLAEIERENTRRRYAHLYAQDLPLPDSTPALQQLVVDRQGNLWAERYRLPWAGEHVWDVIDPRGRWLGAVEIPPVANVLEIGDDYILARDVDDLGVERLVMLGLEKDG